MTPSLNNPWTMHSPPDAASISSALSPPPRPAQLTSYRHLAGHPSQGFRGLPPKEFKD